MSEAKYKFLYEYARKSLDEDLDRFKNIEDKASKFIGFLTILIAVYTAIIKYANTIFLPPSSFLSWLTCVAIILSYIGLASAWSQLFRALRIIYAPRMPLNDSTIELIENNTLTTTYWTLSQTCKNTLNMSRDIIEKKAKHLQIGYQDIAYSASLISTSLILLACTHYFKK